MCGNCKFWRRADAYLAQGLLFAPCELKQDRIVKDRRLAGGLDLQGYVTQNDYVCPKFAERE